MKLVPLQDRVIVKRAEAAKKSGLIIVPEVAKEPPLEGEILALGPDAFKPELGLSVGQRVVFDKYGGHELVVDGEKLLVLKVENIFAVLRSE